ncbi:uncharacterized protein LOC132738248 isoform X1 [Ruditapes philippinarum]|uniref:uncharacterized protein LOC132738248 isoform X1 n=1 Tax=Ruditapes philippinarum TaxID=129788 RepID=UPI00295B11AC|nr:uncharacterized protein LOC132738248 isoform X1 [Ruditapes philippinarum]XP_060581699.1 uncharacterized protein LOC132738248 isoform X1 [Ruditapes philippinarum]
MASENRGCFVWLISLKKSCNERFARFRNRMRQRYYARRGKTLDPETLLNETGNADMVVCKIASKSNKVVHQNMSSVNDDVVDNENSTVIEVTVDDKLVEEYVACIIDKAADTLRQELPSNTETVTVRPADDNISLSSSIISQIADMAVTESLSNIVADADINHSAIRAPRTVTEFKEAFGITGCDITDDGLPPVSE